MPPEHAAGACERCVRRCLLLGELGPLLDYASSDRERLTALLALDDLELIEALGGRRRKQLHSWYARVRAARLEPPAGGSTICVHDRHFPARLRADGQPRLLTVLGGPTRLSELIARPIVALLGCERPSDYGVAVTRALARGVTAAGATVVAGLGAGVARAAHDAAGELGGSLAVLGSGLAGEDRGARLARSHCARRGCAVSELAWSTDGRRWGPVAAERIVAALAAAVVVVESPTAPRGLWAAECARAEGTPLGAVPGMLTNPMAAGPHALLSAGARLVRGPSDVLEMLYDSDAPAVSSSAPGLAPTAQRVLELIGAGLDTPERLAAEIAPPDGGDDWALVAALGELESLGLVSRGEQGRYVRCDLPA
jgi:DNA processing protein